MFNYDHIQKFTSLFLAMLLILISSFLFSHSNSINIDNQLAKSGYIDLSNYDFQNCSHNLNGEWDFYESSFYNPLSKPPEKKVTLTIPDFWNHKTIKNNLIPAKSFGTYNLKVRLNPSINYYALKLPDISSAFELYINNKLISKNGTIGKSFESEKPNLSNTIALFKNDSVETDIIIYVSNFHHSKGGIWDPIILGTLDNIIRIKTIELLKTGFLIGLIFFIMIYNIQFFLMKKYDKDHLFLALICLFCIIRISVIREMIIKDIFPNLDYIIQLKIEYISMIMIFLNILILISRFFKKVFPKELVLFGFTISISYILVILTTKIYVYSQLLNIVIFTLILIAIYSIFVVSKEAYHKNTNAFFVLIGLSAVILSSVSDILYIDKITTNYRLAHSFTFGFIVLMLSLFHVLNINTIVAFEDAEKKTNFKIALLQSQITPHFLHNSINTVIYLIDINPAKAKSLLLEFSTYLRAKFKFETYNKNKTMPLKQELDIIKSYIALQNARFEDKIYISYEVDPESLYLNLPPLLLQPLIENSVQYGDYSKDICILLNIKLNNKILYINIKDNGLGIPSEKLKKLLTDTPSNKSKQGLGIYATNHRLKMMYGRGLIIESNKINGTSIYIEIPIEGDKLL